METGYIYTLTNRVTKSVYVGASNDPSKRFRQHIYALKKGNSHHPKLQADFDIYGEVYDLRIVDKQLDTDSIDRETFWINMIDHRQSLNVQKRTGDARRASERLKAIRSGLENE